MKQFIVVEIDVEGIFCGKCIHRRVLPALGECCHAEFQVGVIKKLNNGERLQECLSSGKLFIKGENDGVS